MAAQDISKAQKRELRRIVALAHERELTRALTALETHHARWRNNEIDVFELNEEIHKFHDGISRELYKIYVLGEPHWGAARGLANGVIEESEIDPALRPRLRELNAILYDELPEAKG